MNIARFAVTRPVAVIMRIASLVLLGAICLTRLPVDLLPKVTLPTVQIVTDWPNVAPEEIETQVTRPIEQAVSSAQGLYQVNSTSVEGTSQVRVQFRWGTDIGQAAVDVLQLVERAKRNFPNDSTLSSPIVYKADPSALPILIFGVSGEQDPVKLRSLMDNEISPIIESASGVASAVVTGGQKRGIIVDVDPDRMRAHHVSLSEITKRLVEENVNLPAGIAKQSNTEYTIRSLGWFSNPTEIANIPVGVYGGDTVKLGDVARVRDEHSEERLFTRLNGKSSVGLVITKQSDANTVSTADAVNEALKKVHRMYPNIKFGLAYDQSTFISDSVNNVRDSALIGGLLAVLILLFFLRNIRSTLVVALSIPTSIISTFALLYMCGFTLNTMSLGGLALATGLIVDDAVVVLENIFRHIERDKKDSFEASIDGTNEIVSAVVASTWTVMVVFLPLFLIRGQAGQMYTQFALVVIFSLAVSLLDATTVVPMLAHRLISGEAHAEALLSGASHPNALMRAFHRFGEWFSVMDEEYRKALKWVLRHRMLLLGVAAGFTLLTLLLIWPVNFLGTELMPQTDSGDFTGVVKLPVGTSLSKTDEVMRQVENIIMSDPEVETAFSAAGTTLSMRGTTTTLVPYQGSVIVKLKDNRKHSTQQVMGGMRKKISSIPGVRFLPTQYDLVSSIMTGGNQNVEVDIFGNDLNSLSSISKEVMGKVRGISGLENIDVNWQDAMPEIQWKVDRQKALELGVSFNDIANTINTATNGTISSYYQEQGFQYPIIVQMPEKSRKTVAEMESMMVTTNPSAGRQVLLSQVAHPIYATGPSQVTRQDRRRYIAVTGVPQERSPGDVQVDVGKAMDEIHLPNGYYWDWGTNQKRQAEEFGGMGLAVFLAIGLIYMLLASQFESFIHPLTILFSVPLAISGVILGLFLTGRAFGLTAFIGVLMLVGICVKNGILLVDYTNQLRSRGLERNEALLQAGPTRLRPILMTASAAALGMLPIALGIGKGSEVQAPMATAVIGGLTTSTFLTLFVVPAVYTLLDDWTSHLARRRSKNE